MVASRRAVVLKGLFSYIVDVIFAMTVSYPCGDWNMWLDIRIYSLEKRACLVINTRMRVMSV